MCCSVAIVNERMDMWKFGPERLFSVPLVICAVYFSYIPSGASFDYIQSLKLNQTYRTRY